MILAIAETDRKMNINGEDSEGSHTATEFVAWYNDNQIIKIKNSI